jgi:hypothetical protein
VKERGCAELLDLVTAALLLDCGDEDEWAMVLVDPGNMVDRCSIGDVN